MTKRNFIKEYKSQLIEYINRKLSDDLTKNVSNSEIEMWILNDEPLYNWARSCGVRI